MTSRSIVGFLLLNIVACKQDYKTDSALNEKIKAQFSKSYLLDKEQQVAINKDSLRSEILFSYDLLKFTFSRYLGKMADSLHSGHADFSIAIYQYASTHTPIRIIKELEADKKQRLEEGFYGPFDKNFQYFLQDENILVHFEALCTSSKHSEWFNIQDSLKRIVIRHIGNKYKDMIKPCQ